MHHGLGRWSVTLAALAALGCGEPGAAPRSDERARTTVPSAAEVRGAGSRGSEEGAGSLPSHERAVQAVFAIVNGRDAPITLVTSAETFRLEPRDGEPEDMGIGGFGPLVEGPSCDCRCGFECLQCEPPEHEERALAPGERHELTYSGRVRVYGGGCFEPYALPPGPRRFTACLEGVHEPDADCVTVEVDYPVPRVELVFR